MAFEIVVPKSIFGGFYKRWNYFAIGFLAHSLQCGQRWLFLFRFQPGKRSYRFGYRTMGNAEGLLTAKDAGWHWPWQDRGISGRG